MKLELEKFFLNPIIMIIGLGSIVAVMIYIFSIASNGIDDLVQVVGTNVTCHHYSIAGGCGFRTSQCSDGATYSCVSLKFLNATGGV